MGETVNAVAVVQCRFGSTRLPGKALKPLAGRSLLSHVLQRAQAMPVDGVVLATTDLPDDDLVVEEAVKLGVQVVRGSEKDVLRRVKLAAAIAQADVVMRVTGDCPLLAPDVGRAVMRNFLQWRQDAGIDYVWNDTRLSGFPDGTDVEVMTYDALVLADRCAGDPGEREHVTKWIRRRLKVGTVGSSVDYSALKLSVDTEDDYQRVQAVMRYLPQGHFSLSATVQAAMRAGVLHPADVP